MSQPEIIGHAVLRDYPLRLWAQQQEHVDALLREFQLLLVGESSGDLEHAAPRQLVEMADMFTARFGATIDALNSERQSALDSGKDRMDSRIPLFEEVPALIKQIEQVLRAVDEYCAAGHLLILPRSEELLALSSWVNSEIITQYEGGEPTAWPGPF